MLKVDQYELIRTASRVYKKDISEISRETGHSRNTIKKALRGEPWGYKPRSHQAYPALEKYLAIIDGWLENDKKNPKKQRHTARRVYNRLALEHTYTGAESTVRRYVREAKVRLGVNAPAVFIPLDPDSGLEAEIDWGSATAIIAGETIQLKFFCMRSKYSGKHFVRFYSCERQQAFFDAHVHAFLFFGGVFPVLIYDNLTTAVQKVLKGKKRIEQESYGKFRAYHNFESRFCTPGEGHEKGGVEGIVGFARRNCMVAVPEAASLEELNQRMLAECLAYGTHTISGRCKTVNELFEAEKEGLLDSPDVPFSNIQVYDGKADKYATVIADKNRYSVPTRYAGFKMRILLYVDRVEIYYGSKKLSSHARVYGNNKWCLDPGHYLELIQQRPLAFNSARPIQQWRQSWPKILEQLLSRFCASQGETKGIKDFISVLMLYQDHDAGEINAVVDLALQSYLSSSEGVKHLLIYANSKDIVQTPLDNWSSLPAPDLTEYAPLGGVH
ncbi:MAG: IS21 family transposase [Candidatus Brocadiales bacterium]|nr:IS21 family transposase [Candidatus Brocadiales bacterium]